MSGVGVGGGDDDSDSDDFMMNMGADSCVENSLFSLSAFVESPVALEFLRKVAEGKDSRAVIANLALFKALSDGTLIESIDCDSLSYNVRSLLLEAVSGKPQEAHFRELFEAADRRKAEEEAERDRQREVGIENWAPEESELEEWRRSGRIDMAHKYVQQLPPKFLASMTGQIRELDLPNF